MEYWASKSLLVHYLYSIQMPQLMIKLNVRCVNFGNFIEISFFHFLTKGKGQKKMVKISGEVVVPV